MAILIVHQGADWNQDLYDRTMERVIPDPSNPPKGASPCRPPPRHRQVSGVGDGLTAR
jgi:hypothetical protein